MVDLMVSGFNVNHRIRNGPFVVLFVADVGFSAAGVEETAGCRLSNAHWGHGRSGGQADFRNGRNLRLQIEAYAALRHAL